VVLASARCAADPRSGRGTHKIVTVKCGEHLTFSFPFCGQENLNPMH
jgi:hypothetical protein